MSAEATQRDLAEMQLFSGLSEGALSQLLSLATEQRFAPGAVVFHEGSSCGDLYLLRHGKVQLQMRVPGHGSIPILTIGPGQLLGWSAVVGTGEMTTSAVALEETEVWVLSGDKLKTLFEQDHHFGYRFMERLAAALARRLVATRLQLLDLFASEAPSISMKEERRG
jgi:CRP-like cAMP-binding protein